MSAILRRAAASLCLLGTLALWMVELRGERSILAFTFLGSLLAAAVAAHVPRLGAHVFVRSVAWVHLGVGSLGALFAHAPMAAMVAATAGASLLALGAGAFEGERGRAAFGPIGYRRAFLFACVILLGAAQVLALAGEAWMDDFHRRAGVLSMIEAALLVASVVGVLRMRAWGVFAALIAAIGAGVTAIAAAIPAARGMIGVRVYAAEEVRTVFAIAAGAALLMVFPIVASRFVPARPWAETRARAPWLHAALVGVAIGVALLGWATGHAPLHAIE